MRAAARALVCAVCTPHPFKQEKHSGRLSCRPILRARTTTASEMRAARRAHSTHEHLLSATSRLRAISRQNMPRFLGWTRAAAVLVLARISTQHGCAASHSVAACALALISTVALMDSAIFARLKTFGCLWFCDRRVLKCAWHYSGLLQTFSAGQSFRARRAKLSVDTSRRGAAVSAL